MDQLKKECADLRKSIIQEEQLEYDQILLEECQVYIGGLIPRIANNLRKTYLLPDELWQLQQTNGFKKFKKGIKL